MNWRLAKALHGVVRGALGAGLLWYVFSHYGEATGISTVLLVLSIMGGFAFILLSIAFLAIAAFGTKPEGQKPVPQDEAKERK